METQEEKIGNRITPTFTKEEMIGMIQELAKQLGHSPSLQDLEMHSPLRRWHIRRGFGSLVGAWRECGIARGRTTLPTPTHELFLEWAGMVRQMGKLPTCKEFETFGQMTIRPYQRRFGRWSKVPAAMEAHAKKNGLESEWADVMEMICEFTAREQQAAEGKPFASLLKPPGIREDRLVYGQPMIYGPLVNEPVNEASVLFLFGAMAEPLGLRMKLVQTAFPDCKALREVAPGKWQDMNIEVELESMNFLRHGHKIEDCDAIVCWVHNWPDCPIEVIALKEVISNQQAAVSQKQQPSPQIDADER
ncbi:MAG TPA: hypothetical protein VFB76_05490 [Candidatus Angelobacter sp.]|nr:hypothetical protein [Candidatus Angelobacter sp.]